MAKRKIIISSESVTEGHPDKMCDLISDAILDEALRQDKNSRVAIETGTKNGGVMVFGEMTTSAYIDIPHVVRNTIKEIGYTKSEFGIEWETCSVWVQITEQSPDISLGVSGIGLHKEHGAGDQGMMYGYATNETKELMPLPILLAHKITKKLAEARKKKEIVYLRPDGKSQVSIEYDKKGKPVRADTIVVSTQHDSGVSYDRIKKDIIEKIIKPVCSQWIDKETVFHVNPRQTWWWGIFG
jgi:S-adenosylmethionine synthetase